MLQHIRTCKQDFTQIFTNTAGRIDNKKAEWAIPHPYEKRNDWPCLVNLLRKSAEHDDVSAGPYSQREIKAQAICSWHCFMKLVPEIW